jgi:hypothetical protein
MNFVNSKLHKRQFIPGHYWRFLFIRPLYRIKIYSKMHHESDRYEQVTIT